MRIGRIFRLFRLLRIFRSVKILISHVFKNRIKGAFKSAFTIAILIVICCSISILIVENDPQSNIKTAVDAIYWSLSSLITGYSGKFPITTEGKAIGLILMFTGIGLIGTFTAYVASWFIEEDLKREKK
jgi:voltage-gated potassium channel